MPIERPSLKQMESQCAAPSAPSFPSLFLEDSAAHEAAELCGFKIVRSYRSVEILDEKAVIAAGYVTEPKVDKYRVARDLKAGIEVEGARLKGYEYVLGGVRE